MLSCLPLNPPAQKNDAVKLRELEALERKSGVEGKRVDLGGWRIIKKKKKLDKWWIIVEVKKFGVINHVAQTWQVCRLNCDKVMIADHIHRDGGRRAHSALAHDLRGNG